MSAEQVLKLEKVSLYEDNFKPKEGKKFQLLCQRGHEIAFHKSAKPNYDTSDELVLNKRTSFHTNSRLPTKQYSVQ